MLLNKSYYYWYYRLVFYLDWLFQYRRGLMSTFNMKYIFTKLSLKTCIYCFFSCSLCLRPLPSPSSSLSIFLLQGVWEDGVFYDRFYCITQADHQI